MPLRSAPRANDSTVSLGLVASANLEWRCRSAMIFKVATYDMSFVGNGRLANTLE